MSARGKETTTTPIYSTPGLFRMEQAFDQALITGSYDTRALIEAYLSSGLRRNITEHRQQQRADYLKYFLFLQPQAFDPSGTSEYTYFGGLAQANITSSARAQLALITDRSIAKRAHEILDAIEAELRTYDAAALPSIGIAELDDESIIIEWVFDHFRTGFNLESHQQESGYFLVSDSSAGEIRSSGYLKGLRLRPLIRSLLTLILNN